MRRRRGGRAALWLVLGLLVGGTAGAGAIWFLKGGAIAPGIPGGPRLGRADELALVPADAVGFVHLRARDMWKSPVLKEFRHIVEQAGPESLNSLDEAFAPKPSTLDRVTIVFVSATQAPEAKKEVVPPKKGPPGAPKGPAPDPDRPLFSLPEHVESIGILQFTAPFDAGKVREGLLKNGASKQQNGKEYWQDGNLAVYFPSDTVLVAAKPVGMEHFLRLPPDSAKKEGPLSAAIEHAAEGGRHYVAALNARAFHINFKKLNEVVPSGQIGAGELVQLARDAEPILRAEAFALSGTIASSDSKLDLRAYYADDSSAEQAEKGIRSFAAFVRNKLSGPREELEKKLKGQPDGKKPRSLDELPTAILSLLGVGAINHLDAYLANPPVEQKGREVVASFDVPSIGEMYAGSLAVTAGMLLPAVDKVRTAAATTMSSNNLRQIDIAMTSYHNKYGAFPTSSPGADKDAPKLSWRVQLLPYLDQAELYHEFNLQEPWDSAQNKKLIGRMPRVYQAPNAAAPPGQTYYKVFSGAGAVFGPGKRTRITDIADGTTNTILVVEGGDPVTWTKPDDIAFDPNKPLPNLRLQGNPVINVLMADGTVKTINLDKISPQTLKTVITMAGGEVLGPDWP